MKNAAQKGIREAQRWIDEFNKVAEHLEVKI